MKVRTDIQVAIAWDFWIRWTHSLTLKVFIGECLEDYINTIQESQHSVIISKKNTPARDNDDICGERLDGISGPETQLGSHLGFIQ